MNRGVGALSLVAVLAGGCVQAEFPMCPAHEPYGPGAPDSADGVERALLYEAETMVLLESTGSAETVIVVDEVEAAVGLAGEACSGIQAGHTAQVLLAVEAGESLSVLLPADLWMPEQAATQVSIRSNEVTAFGSASRVPYEPPEDWLITGIRASGGCDEPVSVEARISREACADLQNCASSSFVEVATFELPLPWCDDFV